MMINPINPTLQCYPEAFNIISMGITLGKRLFMVYPQQHQILLPKVIITPELIGNYGITVILLTYLTQNIE